MIWSFSDEEWANTVLAQNTKQELPTDLLLYCQKRNLSKRQREDAAKLAAKLFTLQEQVTPL